MLESVLFVGATAVLLLTAVLVVMARSPLRAALYLICSLCTVAMLYILLEASFVAAMQVLVYAGAIMVLFVFVIMLLNITEEQSKGIQPTFAKVLGGLSIVYIAGKLAWAATTVGAGNAPAGEIDGTVASVGTLLLTDYLFGFEAISILLLVSVIGAVVLGMNKRAA